MPLVPAKTYESLDDKEIILSDEIKSIAELSPYSKQIEEILLLPKDIITLFTLKRFRTKEDVTPLIKEQALIRGMIEDKVGYWDIKTGKFV